MTKTTRRVLTPAEEAERAYNERVRLAVEKASAVLKAAGIGDHIHCYESFGLDMMGGSSPCVGTVEARRIITTYVPAFKKVYAFEDKPTSKQPDGTSLTREQYLPIFQAWKVRWLTWCELELATAEAALKAAGIAYRKFHDDGQPKLRLITEGCDK